MLKNILESGDNAAQLQLLLDNDTVLEPITINNFTDVAKVIPGNSSLSDISRFIRTQGRIYQPVINSIARAISVINQYDAPKVLWLNGDLSLNGASIPSVIVNPNGDNMIILKSNDPYEINTTLQEYLFRTLLAPHANRFVNLIQNSMVNKITERNKDQIDLVFRRKPELAAIGTKEEYRQYLLSIFPESVETSIYWHGSNSDFSEGFDSVTERGEGSGAPETKGRTDMYFNKQAYASIQYVDEQNRSIGPDRSGFNHWNKLYWELKEILSNGITDDSWRRQVIDDSTIRQEIPNKHGIFDHSNSDKTKWKGKTLSFIKRNYRYKDDAGVEHSYEKRSDEDFFKEVFGLEYGQTFNEWIAKNKKIFKDMEAEAPGIYPVILNIKKPIKESNQDTYYEGHRKLFTRAAKKGNDAILGAHTKNEFNTDVAVMLSLEDDPSSRVHFLGTSADIEAFKQWKLSQKMTPDNIIHKLLRDPILNNFMDSEGSATEKGFNTLREQIQYLTNQAINDLLSDTKYFKLEKVITTGLTGVDQLSTKYAEELGYVTEQGTLGDLQSSDGLVYIATGEDLLSGQESTELKAARESARFDKKPFMVIYTPEELRQFITDNNIRVLSIAGSIDSDPQLGDDTIVNDIVRNGLSPSPWITKEGNKFQIRLANTALTVKFTNARDLAEELFKIRIVNGQNNPDDTTLKAEMEVYAKSIITGILPSGEDLRNNPEDMQKFIDAVIKNGNC